MKKHINKKISILLVFSAILFSTATYFMSSSLVLGAAAGGGVASEPVTAEDGAAITPPMPKPSATQEEPKKETTTENTIAENKEKEIPKEVYVVKEGQTLWEIAQDSGLSIQTLMNKNQLSSSVIVEGQELVFEQ